MHSCFARQAECMSTCHKACRSESLLAKLKTFSDLVEMFYLLTHSTHFIDGYMTSDIR